jgi:hypothetical protein
VTATALRSTLSRPSLPFTLADVQTALGQPAHVLALNQSLDWYTLGLIYPQQGTILLEYGRVPPPLANDWRPEVVIFSDQPLVDELFGEDAALLMQWQGMQPFAFYCRDENGAICPPTQSP